MRPPLLLALLLSFAGCGQQGSTEGVVVQYHQALGQGDGKRALTMLTRATREKLAAIAEATSAASGGTVSPEPSRMIVQGDLSRYTTPDGGKAKLTTRYLEGDRSHAKVAVTIDGETFETALVLEDGQWRIELPL